jgi:hypothetical protein
MNAILSFFSHGLALAAGMIIASFFLIQSFICLFFALPLTMRLKRDFAFIGRPPFLRYFVAPLFLGGMFSLISWGVGSWFPNHAIAYWIGVALIVLLGLRSCFGGGANMEEYLRANEDVLLPEVVEDIRNGSYFK